MTKQFLGSGWFVEVLEAAGKLPKVKGADLRVDFEISKTPKSHEMAGKKIRCFAEISDGQLLRFEMGKSEDTQVSVRCEYKDALEVRDGKLDPEVGYMQGRLKVDGAYELLLFNLRDFFATKAWVEFLKKVRSKS